MYSDLRLDSSCVSQPQIHPNEREESDIADCRQVISALKQEDVQRSIRIRIVLMIEDCSGKMHPTGPGRRVR